MAAPKTATKVRFNAGGDNKDAFALVDSENEDGTLNLIYFPLGEGGNFEYAPSIPYGGPNLGRTWY